MKNALGKFFLKRFLFLNRYCQQDIILLQFYQLMKTLLIGINSKFSHTNSAIRSIKEYIVQKSNLSPIIKEFTINQLPTDILRDIIFEKTQGLWQECNRTVIYRCGRSIKEQMWNYIKRRFYARPLRRGGIFDIIKAEKEKGGI